MTARVERLSSPSGNRDNDYFQPTCDACGWKGASYSNRTVEGRTLAEKHAAEHRCGDRVEIATAWSDYRKDYGVSADPDVRAQEHKAFVAGWRAARGASDAGGVQR